MNYIEVTFICSPANEVFSDILSSLLADVGFESFVPTSDGLIAYVQGGLYDQASVDFLLETFPMDNVAISYNAKEIEGKDWNEEWEKNYFKPLVVDDRCIVQSTFHNEPAIYEFNIVIDPKMAFGTGHHQTTELMMREILELDLQGKFLLDMGCGTAILAILSSMKGADPITAIDIDKWAYDNAIENISLNKTNNIEVKIGGAEVISDSGNLYDVILANINRNILLQDICVYNQSLNEGGLLLMSGFYEEDIPSIKEECAKHGLKFIEYQSKENWAAVKFQK